MTEKNFSRVTTVVDVSIDSDTIYALHASSSSSTLFLKGKDVLKYLRTLETSETKLQIVDFAELATSSTAGAAPAAVSAPAAQTKEKEDAKIEGAVQIAIGVKKEVDFASWYTNVRFLFDKIFLMLIFNDQVLIKADMLDYYSVSGCYILKPWSYSIWEEIQRMINWLSVVLVTRV